LYEGPEHLAPWIPKRRRPALLSLAFNFLLADRWLIAFLIVALVVNLALWLFLAIRFPGLNDLLPLHFDAQGFPDRIEAKNGIFNLPLIGLVIVFANAGISLLTRVRERAAGILLAVSAVLVEVLLWLATLNIVGGFV
jgi:hypothetical protein